MITSDAFLAIGATHAMCEDYIRTGIIGQHIGEDVPFAIVSDGCSGSPNTDIGSRLLTIAAEKTIKTIHSLNSALSFGTDYRSLGFIISNEANQLNAGNTVTPKQCLDATLIMMAGMKTVYVYGDGYIILQFTSGRIIIIELSCYKGAPPYLSYQTQPERLDMYNSKVPKAAIKVKAWELNGGPVIEFNGWEFGYQGGKFQFNVSELIHVDIGSFEEITTTLISSDGLGSFIHVPTGEQVPVDDIVAKLFDRMPNHGKFIQRRAKRVLKELAKDQIVHNDDVSIAGMTWREDQV